MPRAEPMTPEAAEIDRQLAEAGYGIVLTKKELATVMKCSTRSIDRLIALRRLKFWRNGDAGSSKVLVLRRRVAELLAQMG